MDTISQITIDSFQRIEFIINIVLFICVAAGLYFILKNEEESKPGSELPTKDYEGNEE